MEKLGLTDARQIMAMINGNEVPASKMSVRIAQTLRQEGLVISKTNGSRCKLLISHSMRDSCRIFLSQHFGIDGSLEQWIEGMEKRHVNRTCSRAELVGLTGHSKYRPVRTFHGFLVNSYTAIEATLDGKPLTICPIDGSAVFVSKPDAFHIPEDVTIVGMENAENFVMIRGQKTLFNELMPGRQLLFVSRYPQNATFDLRSWLQSIPNQYVHFGDFDLAGIHIFLSEYYAYLGERASFLIPPDIERRLEHGNSDLYNQQYAKFKEMEVLDVRLQPLVKMLHHYRKGYEQEGYIESD